MGNDRGKQTGGDDPQNAKCIRASLDVTLNESLETSLHEGEAFAETFPIFIDIASLPRSALDVAGCTTFLKWPPS